MVEPALHPWNRSFTWADRRGPFTTTSAEQAKAFDEDGFFVFEDAFDAGTIERLDAELTPGVAAVARFLEEHTEDGRFTVAGLDTQVVAPHQVTRSDWVRGFCAHPVLTGLCRDLVGPEVRLYWDQPVYKQPHSAEPVLYHQDNGYTFVEPQSYLTCWIAITDATPDNGCVRAVPGVHRLGTLAHRNTPIGYECDVDDSIAVDVPVRAGSIVVFTSLTPHATARNTTDDIRKAYIVQYAPEGAVAFHGDGTGGRGDPVPQTDERRQFPVVRAGEPVR